MSFRALPAITVFVAAAISCVTSVSPARAATVSLAHDDAGASGQPAAPAELSTFPQPSGWPALRSQSVVVERIGPGVQYERWALSTAAGPLVVSLATIDLREPRVRLAVTTHDGAIVGPGQPLSAMADAAGAELGINADYFDISGSGSPLNLVIEDGRVLHAPDAAATFVVDSLGGVHMGSLGLRVRVDDASGATRAVSAVNDWSPGTDLALVTPQLGTSVADGATEVVLVPQDAPDQYQVLSVQTGLVGLVPLAAGQLGLVGRGAQATALVRDFHPSDRVVVTMRTVPDVGPIQAGVGGGPLLVERGKAIADAGAPAPEETLVRNPVTGAGLSADGRTLWLVVVDGRRPAYSIGLTRPQLAELFVALGARTAMAFDSGGSSEMAVRHLGDPATSVVSAPSDGRERSIADGLIALNTATPGPVASVYLRAAAAQVLAGSSLHLDVRAVDASDLPVALRESDAILSSDAPSLAVIDGAGLRAIVPAHAAVAAGATIALGIDARTRDGQPVVVDASAVRWSSQGQGSVVRADGTFVAGEQAASTVVSASAGGTSASAVVLSGEHAVTLAAVPVADVKPPGWHYAARPPSLAGAVDATAAPDGSPALRLAYDFSATPGSRAAYAQTALPLPGEPIALALDVYGDGGGAWLRGGYLNADGNSESLTIARRVDWRGWRTLRIAIPPQASWPITWTRIYLVEPSPAAHERGAVWLRDLTLFFAGP